MNRALIGVEEAGLDSFRRPADVAIGEALDQVAFVLLDGFPLSRGRLAAAQAIEQVGHVLTEAGPRDVRRRGVIQFRQVSAILHQWRHPIHFAPHRIASLGDRSLVDPTRDAQVVSIDAAYFCHVISGCDFKRPEAIDVGIELDRDQLADVAIGIQPHAPDAARV